MKTAAGYAVLAVLIGLTALGIVSKFLFANKMHRLEIFIYLVMGWACVFIAGDLLRSMTKEGLLLLLAGGLCYTGGVIFYVIRREFFHVLWHLCVLAGMFFWYTCVTKIREGKVRKALLFVSNYSFCIYLFHEMGLTILRKVFAMLLPQTAFSALLQFFGPAAAVIAGCILLSWLLDRYTPRIYRIVSGGRSKF